MIYVCILLYSELEVRKVEIVMHTLLEFGDKSITHCFQTLFKYVYVLLCLHVHAVCILFAATREVMSMVLFVYSEISLICHNWGCQFYGGLMGLAD